jgi:hypothetical protein
MKDHLGTPAVDIFGALVDLKIVGFYETGLASPLNLLYHNIHTNAHLATLLTLVMLGELFGE